MTINVNLNIKVIMTDWKDAPSWAKFKAIDANGWVYWFELEPIETVTGWYTTGKLQIAGRPDWRTTVEPRP